MYPMHLPAAKATDGTRSNDLGLKHYLSTKSIDKNKISLLAVLQQALTPRWKHCD